MFNPVRVQTTGAHPAPIDLIPAVQRCIRAWTEALDSAKSQGKSELTSADFAAEAYRLAMPALISEEAIAEFIACTAHGIIVGAFEDRQGSQLLYAAQVASAAFDRARKSQKQRALPVKRDAT